MAFVGQAPGQEEDEQGQCFVGPAGQLLSQAIRHYKLKPVWLTNLVRCLPPGGGKKADREPKKDEIEACRPYVEEELRRLRPKVIVTLGNVPLKFFSGKTGVKTWNGTVVGEWEGAKVFCLLHPSYILRYRKDLSLFETGLRELQYVLGRKEKPSEVPVREVSPGDLLKWLGSRLKKPIAFDLETSGKFKCDGGLMRTASFSDGEEAVWMDMDFEKNEEAVQTYRAFLKSPIEKIAHGMVFEYRWCIDSFGFEPKALKWCTLMMHHLVDEQASHRLDAVAGEAFGARAWDIDPQMEENEWDWSTVPTDTLGPYNAIDSFWTARLQSHLWGKLDEKRRYLYRKLVRKQAVVCARLESRGLKVDADWCAKVDQEYAKHQEEIVEKFTQEKPVRQLIRHLDKDGKKFNMNSPHQMKKLFFDYMGLPIYEWTDSGAPSAKESALLKIGPNPVVDQYLAWKSKTELRLKFLQKFPRFISSDGLVHASFNPGYVVTGRLSVTNPPAQAIPEASLTRGMIVSRFKGGKIASIDWKQLEVRLLASESKDENLMDAVRKGLDLHDHTATLMFGKDFTKRQRSIAKRLNFGIAYGISAYSIAREFNMSETEAENILRLFQKAYSRVFTWMRRQHVKVERDGWIENRFGRIRHFPQYKSSMTPWQREAMFREAGNFPIASQGADLTNLSMIYVDRDLRKSEALSIMCHQVHDSVLVDVHPEEIGTVPGRCRQVMEKVVVGKCPWLEVPLAVDVEVSDRWGMKDA